MAIPVLQTETRSGTLIRSEDAYRRKNAQFKKDSHQK